ALPAPLDSNLQSQLINLYARYNADISAGDLGKALTERTPESRKDLGQFLKTPEERAKSLAMARTAVPQSFEVEHSNLARDGKHASILIVAILSAPVEPQSQEGSSVRSSVRSEVTLAFAQGSDGWKLDNQVFGIDPDTVQHCPDETFEPIDAYDRSRSVNAGGSIVRVDFAPDHTLVVFRLLDRETCAFLPDRDHLAKAGFDLGQLVPYALIELTGFPHKTDQQKIWIDHLTVTPE